MDFQKGAGLLADGVGVVGKAGLVGGTNLPEHRAAGGHHIRHPEGAADLHQLSTGGNDFSSGGEGGEDQQHRRCVVVYHHGGLRPGKAAQKRLYMGVPLPPFPRCQVIFQGGVALRDPSRCR